MELCNGRERFVQSVVTTRPTPVPPDHSPFFARVPGRPPLADSATFSLWSPSSPTAGCGGSARLPVSAGIEPRPTLPTPDKSFIPVVNVVDAKGWPATATPVAAQG